MEPWKSLDALPSVQDAQPRTRKLRLTAQSYRCFIKASELMSISGINCKMRIMLVIRYYQGNVLIFQTCWKISHLFSIVSRAKSVSFDFYCVLLPGTLHIMYWQMSQSKRVERWKRRNNNWTITKIIPSTCEPKSETGGIFFTSLDYESGPKPWWAVSLWKAVLLFFST